MSVALRDAVGAEVELSLDGSIRRHTLVQFYWETFYSDSNPDHLVARGSAAEESIIAILKRIVGQWY